MQKQSSKLLGGQEEFTYDGETIVGLFWLIGHGPAVRIAGKKLLKDHQACACHSLTEAFCHPASIKKSHVSGRNP